ncbi:MULTISPECIES: DUF5615 family PIN-like protein [Mycolicibacterium]|uniref:DUF5615 family PIN-like protein n=1 Tax=Mycolicibacterium TaxID=1866885 RepID=UPI00055E5FF5|nr:MULTISPECIES: DUF5615 family PIN-like protein [Mycolicibacterium]MCV7334669.1 DUF5615 family PIN-like protein [Mycolicibacterium senegalense]MDR7291860.1 putative nuclease of putative toxin-antitoxin system [Mycolicibacterium senegalense]QZA23296.1 DUF5615 family PIN-like protein [Mycolicibacterium senegalense]
MKFLVDAQLPIRLCDFLNRHGHDAVHVSALPDGNGSSDAVVAEVADAEDRVVVTKDSDFRHSHLTVRSPRRLLIVATGNISNTALLDLVELRLDDLANAFAGADLVELRSDLLVVHQGR